MRNKFVLLLLLTVFFSFGSKGHAQINCGPVSDEAGVLNGNIDASGLINQGADVHVVTVASISKYGVRLADVEKGYEKACPTWLSENGQRKANLIVVMVAPTDRKKNLFFGGAYRGMFSGVDEINTLYSAAANPYFHNGQWVDGINATLRDLNMKVVEYHDQAKHPATVVNQATDLSGFVDLLGWVFGIALIGIILAFIFKQYKDRLSEKAAIRAAQQKAIRARNEATDAFLALDKSGPRYSEFAAKFQNLSNSISTDPNTDGLTMADYEGIEESWNKLQEAMDESVHPNGSSFHIEGRGTRPSFAESALHTSPTHETHSSSAPAGGVQTTGSTVVVENNHPSGDGFLTGMLVGEAMSNFNSPREVVYESAPAPEPAHEERQYESNGFGGNDSSFGSDSYDSSFSGNDSSFSDSGSDSSFGGSDSGF